MPELIAYTPVKKGEAYDLRLYQPYTVAETEYSRECCGLSGSRSHFFLPKGTSSLWLKCISHKADPGLCFAAD